MTSRTEEIKDFRLDGRVAVVTGGGSGIGRAIAMRFASAGATVHVIDINLGDAEQTSARIESAGNKAKAFACDVADQKQVAELFDSLISLGRIHILVNNAGIAHVGTLDTTSEPDFDRVYRVNVKGIYNCMHASIAHMKEHGGGVILNMASIAGSTGLSDRFAYSMSKGAVIAMTYSVAKDYVGYNVRCNCISPARVHTPFVDGFIRKNYPGKEQEMFERLAKSQPIGRMAEPGEVAALALFLCSDAASFITGTDYPLDGGYFKLRG